MNNRLAAERTAARFRVATTHAGIPMVFGRPGGPLTDANEAMCEFLGRTAEELAGMTWQQITHPDDVGEDERLFEALSRGELPSYRLTKRYLHADGSVRYGTLNVAAVANEDGEVDFTIAQIVDVTREHEANERLEFLARRDPLTGLLSRSAITGILTESLAQAQATRGRVGLLFADLHRFRLVNDSFGHTGGDALLQVAADRILGARRTGMHVGRFGGDHFVLVVPEVLSETTLERMAEALITAVGVEVVVGGHPIVPSLCVGIAVSHPGSTADELLRDVETALTGAQAAGRNRWRFFDAAMHDRAVRRLRVEQELRDAVDRRQFVVHFQPLVSLKGRGVIGYEALVRWKHPSHGLLSPGDFLEVAEETGLVIRMGHQVLDAVCRRIAEDPATGRVSVNYSAGQLTEPNWRDVFLDCLDRHHVGAHRLVIEVTETAVMPVIDDVRDDLAMLRAQGVGVHIDDFGTGFSSLAMLRDLPVTGLKLDRSFVSSLTEHASYANALASGVAGLANGLGIETIAEGIETEEQAALLTRQGWRFGQGYLFGRPSAW